MLKYITMSLQHAPPLTPGASPLLSGWRRLHTTAQLRKLTPEGIWTLGHEPYLTFTLRKTICCVYESNISIQTLRWSPGLDACVAVQTTIPIT